eukprot:Gregarina_sp_Poly_1__7732@NODE_436_length_8449_cov_138_152470_g356_i0_p8_GENE_NODE_436_length_8449_cov_138_152470_g356_i0NODE_436_length_8449_cov_138_152470_g356_i0_p8_ORF_typecomplete_len124_score22_90DUF1153/PF06627_11/0_31_NODE_436_length_8449_cov_138_152470_g356_i057116082
MEELPDTPAGELYDLSNLDSNYEVEVTIIQHAPATLIYGDHESDEAAEENPNTETWTARRKAHCFCAILPDNRKKAKVAHEMFALVVMALDCDDSTRDQNKQLLSMAPATQQPLRFLPRTNFD